METLKTNLTEVYVLNAIVNENEENYKLESDKWTKEHDDKKINNNIYG